MGGLFANEDKGTLIKWAVSIVLAGIFLLIPEQGIYTYNVKMFMAITVFCLAVVAMELLGEYAVGILLPSLYCFFNVAPAATIFSPWVGTTMMLFFGAMFFAATLENCGLLHRVALWIMCKLKGNYILLLLAIMMVGVVLNLMTSGRGYLVIGALAFGLCKSLNAIGTRVGAAIAVSAMVGSCTSHVFSYAAGSWAVIKQMGAEFISNTDITPLGMILHNWPMFFVCVLIVVVIGKIYKPEGGTLGDVSYLQYELDNLGKMSREEKWNLVMMMLVLVYIFTVDWHGLNINYAFMIIPWMVLLPGIKAADAKTVRSVNTAPIIFAAACMGIGTVASSLGLGNVLVDMLSTLMHGSTSPVVLIAIVFIIVFGLNFLMTPLAIFALITAPLLTLAVNLGFSPIPFAYAICGLSEAIILPYEYIPYLIIYSFGMIKMKDFIVLNALRSVMVFLGYLVLLVPYWMFIGLF